MLPALQPALLVLPALALAAGVDLYLTLLFLGVAPFLGLWPELPGALGDLASPGVVLLTGAFYLAEAVADRGFAPSLVWNGLHALIRPLAGALLALLALEGRPSGVLVLGAALSALLASGAHAIHTGGSLLLRLERTPPVRPAFASALEDAGVLGLLSLALDRPGAGAALAGLMVVAGLPLAGSQLRAFVFSVRLVLGRVRRILVGGSWTRPEDFPRWLRTALAHEPTAPGGLRGTPGAALRLPGQPRLVLGWVVARGETPLFVHGRAAGARVELGELRPRALEDRGFLRSAELVADRPPRGPEPPGGTRSRLLLTRDGPSLATLRAEFRLD